MKNNYTNKVNAANADETAFKLFDEFRNGNINAFSGLYDIYVNVLYSYGCHLTTDMELLKDCIQEVFVKIYNKRADLGSVLNFKSYLFISLKNKLCDESRKRVNLSDISIDELNITSSSTVEKEYITREKELLNNVYVENILNQLSSRQRKAITLYYLEEKKYEDICGIMNINYQSVRNLIHRGMTKMRACVV